MPLFSVPSVMKYVGTAPVPGSIRQFQGVDPNSGITYIYKVDYLGNIVSRYNADKKIWETGSFAKPGTFTPLISASQSSAAINKFLADKTFIPKTKYVVIGDEPKSAAPYVVNLGDYLPSQNLDTIKKLFQTMPRQFLFSWFKKEIWPGLPGPITTPGGNDIYGDLIQMKPTQDMIWAAFIDLFNQSNLAYVNQIKIPPWVWEDQKTKAYLISQSQPGLQELQDKFNAYRESVLGIDPVAQSLIQEFNSLPKLGDPGLEISRQYAIDELLKRKEYGNVRIILDAYKFGHNSILDEAMRDPIPFNLTTGDGKIVRATP